ncbi:MAG: sensor histidine kinase [Treponema sp.]|nr:sensor histidine kinase [Treponema sp.]MEE3314022.1 sensor histidine kinase [Treponema sp.]
MKKLLLILIALILTFSLVSCSRKKRSGAHDSKKLYLAWKNFNDKKDTNSCRDFVDELEKFEPDSLDAYPDLREQTKEQILTCRTESRKILSLIEAGEPDPILIYEAGRKINLNMLSYLYNQNYVLEETHQKIFDYFVWLLITIVLISVVLIFLNAREVRKRDKIIYNSEQFLRHSIEVQEAERRRISQELHDTVAQSMRYVSLLAENLSDKEAAEKIISTQNQNIEDIRKLCYNLTPPAISGDDMIGALELLASKIFNGSDDNFDLRIVADESVDFSIWSDVQLMSIYRIIQEAFQNIEKHALASEVTVLFRKETDGKLKIIISDDGVGMDLETVAQINEGIFTNIKDLHFGVRNIVERVQLLGGTVTYRSEPDCGTQITVVL